MPDTHPNAQIEAITTGRKLNILGVSPTVAIASRVAALRNEGRPVIGLHRGEPDFPAPDCAIKATQQAAQRGQTRYTAPDGGPEIKAAVVEKFERDNGLHFVPQQIHVASGAKQVIHNALAASLKPGDEVIIPVPYWPAYADMVRFLGAQPRFIETNAETDFKLSPRLLKSAITERTRWLILNTPHNPTGAVYTRIELRALADVVRCHSQLWVLADEIYEHIAYSREAHVSIGQVAPDLAEQILTVNGVSKAYSMTGWRIGFAGGPASLIKVMAQVQSLVAGSSSEISQIAAATALTSSQTLLYRQCSEYRECRLLAITTLQQCRWLSCYRGEGAFYLFVGCDEAIGKMTPQGRRIASDIDLAEYLLEEANVAVVPGTAFGTSPYFRLCYAVELELLREACLRIVMACEALS